ncbi:MAG: hypothetical protein WAJ87_03930, partial [Bryobacteraceae bacterium]
GVGIGLTAGVYPFVIGLPFLVSSMSSSPATFSMTSGSLTLLKAQWATRTPEILAFSYPRR